MLRLASPWALVLIPLVVAAAIWMARRRRHGDARVVLPQATVRIPSIASPWVAVESSLPWLRGVILVLLVAGVARPQAGSRLETTSALGVDIVIVLDASDSMRGEDFAPLHRLHAHRPAGAIERTEPGALELLAVQAGQLHDGQHVVGQDLAVALQGVGAVLARLAAGDADLDQLALGEQAQRLRRAQHRAPVEMRAGGGVHGALGVALLARELADCVAQLLHQQRLVAVNGVQAPEPALQVGLELAGGDLH